MNKEALNISIKYIKGHLHTFLALILGILLIIFILNYFHSFVLEIFTNYNTDKSYIYSIYGFILIVWTTYWSFFRWRLPRNKKGKIGIVISLFTENEIDKIRLKTDFISKLEKDISDEGLSNNINIILLKNHLAEQVKNPSDIKKINKKINAHFILWGRIIKRPDGSNKKKKYFFQFEGYVSHSPVNVLTKNKIQNEFVNVLPKQVDFWENLQFRGFELTASFVYIAIKHIVGIAAFVSGDPLLAKTLHEKLLKEFNKFESLPPNLQKVRDSSLWYLSEEYFVLALHSFLVDKDIAKTKELLNLAFEKNNKNYGAWLLKSQIDFLIDNNVDESFKSANKAKNTASQSAEWLYTLAFLNFWTEKYKKALKYCKIIKNQSFITEETTLAEVRDFNCKILYEHPDKAQLYFWLGYLSYFKRNHLPDALTDFENFQKKFKDKESDLYKKGMAYLKEIKQKMS